MHFEHTGLLAAEKGEDAVRRGTVDGLLPVEPTLELAHLLVVLVHSSGQRRGEHGAAAEDIAHAVADGGILADALGNDVAGALQVIVRGVGRHHTTHNAVGQWFETFLDGNGGAGAALGTVGQVEVL